MARAPTRQGQGKRQAGARTKRAPAPPAPAPETKTPSKTDGFAQRGAVEVYRGRVSFVRARPPSAT